MPAGSMAIRRSAGKKKNARIWCWCWTATCPATALEAMCFHLDRRGTPDSLAFVQFPQMFHNLSRNDIYTNDLRFYLYPTIPGQFPGSEPRRQPLSAVRSSARTVWILRFPVILHKSPRTSSKYNPPSTLLSQNIFSNKSLKFSEINSQSTHIPPATAERPTSRPRAARPRPPRPELTGEREKGRRERRSTGRGRGARAQARRPWHGADLQRGGDGGHGRLGTARPSSLPPP